MQRRYLIGGLALILAIAIAVPALGVDAGSSVTVKKVSKKLKKLTKRVAALEATDQVPGPEGPPGPQGEQGEQGPIGPSDASAEADASIAIPDAKGEIQDGPTPAGDYIFWAKVDLTGGAAGTDVECDLVTTTPNILQDRATVDNPGGEGATVALLGTATTFGAGEVRLLCEDGVGGTVTASNVRLVVQRVGDLTEE